MTVTLQNGRVPGGHLRPSAVQVLATNAQYGAICEASVRALPAALRGRIRVSTLGDWRDVAGKEVSESPPEAMLWVCRLADIPERAQTPAAKSKVRKLLVFVEEMPVEAIPSRVSGLNVRHPRRLHIARERNPKAISSIIRRVIAGTVRGDGRSCIADAWIEEANLVLLSPSFERLYVPTTALEEHLGSDGENLKAFEIDEDGSYLHWPHADAHLGWEQLRGIVDPATLVAAQRRSREFNVRYGAAIRRLREEHGHTQAGIKGIADRHLRRVEHGQVAATSSVLKSLAAAHDMSLSDYLAELAERL